LLREPDERNQRARKALAGGRSEQTHDTCPCVEEAESCIALDANESIPRRARSLTFVGSGLRASRSAPVTR
jgi:hypothetical protein